MRPLQSESGVKTPRSRRTPTTRWVYREVVEEEARYEQLDTKDDEGGCASADHRAALCAAAFQHGTPRGFRCTEKRTSCGAFAEDSLRKHACGGSRTLPVGDGAHAEISGWRSPGEL